ncbi:MAG TPA: BON domain-containing protein [Burkholderiaceae bacterium]|nr:BON domain-containing protein [Burkholderiaceae bacterium]
MTPLLTLVNAGADSPSGNSLKRHACRARAAWLVLAGTLIAFACSAPDPRTAQERGADEAVAAQVEAALQSDDIIYARHIDVEARRGVVWLTGWVITADQARKAVIVASAVPGVQRVVDGIEVKDYFSQP